MLPPTVAGLWGAVDGPPAHGGKFRGDDGDVMADSPRQIINECLADEWCFRPDDGTPSDDWPFDLEYWGEAEGWQLFRFDDSGTQRYAGYAPSVGVISGAVAGLGLQDIVDEFRGGDWILERQPLNLDEADAQEDDSLPSRVELLQAISLLVAGALGKDAEFEILRAFYLEATGEHLALVRRPRARQAVVVCTAFDPIEVLHVKASPERRLAIAIGRQIVGGAASGR